MTRRFGAYLLTGDPTWLASSLSRYYDLLDDLVVLVPRGGRSWTNRTLPVEACLEAIRTVDVAGKARIVTGEWIDLDNPMRAETAQRQCGLENLRDSDWVFQIDNDEVLPDPVAIVEMLNVADREKASGVEWPMRVLYRHLGSGDYLEVVSDHLDRRYEYPGPVLVRPDAHLVEGRRIDGIFVRPVMAGDADSTQITASPAPNEIRMSLGPQSAAIVHNSWGRSPSVVWRKIRSFGHQSGWRGVAYFALIWWPAPVRWRRLHNFHPFAKSLWPRLTRTSLPDGLLSVMDEPPERRSSRQTKRLA